MVLRESTRLLLLLLLVSFWFSSSFQSAQEVHSSPASDSKAAVLRHPVPALSEASEYERAYILLPYSASSAASASALALGSGAEKTHCTRLHCSLAPLRLSVESDVHVYHLQLLSSLPTAGSPSSPSSASSLPTLSDRTSVTLSLSHDASLSSLLVRLSPLMPSLNTEKETLDAECQSDDGPLEDFVETRHCVTTAVHTAGTRSKKAECVLQLPAGHSAYALAVQVLEPSLSVTVPYCLLLRAHPATSSGRLSTQSLRYSLLVAGLVLLASTVLCWRWWHRLKSHSAPASVLTAETRSGGAQPFTVKQQSQPKHTQKQASAKDEEEVSPRRVIHHQRSRSALPGGAVLSPRGSARDAAALLTAQPPELNAREADEQAKRRARWRRSRGGKHGNSSDSSDGAAASSEFGSAASAATPLQILSPAQWQQWTEGLRDRGVRILGTADLTLRERIGCGAHGSVYRADYGGAVVAAKQLSRSSSVGARAFRREVELLHTLKHPNLLCMLALAVLPPPPPTLDESGGDSIGGSATTVHSLASSASSTSSSSSLSSSSSAFPRIYMIAEYVSGGDLFKYLEKLRTRLSGGGDGVRNSRGQGARVRSISSSSSGELRASLQPPLGDDLVADWARDICAGMAYLHAQRPHPILHRDLKSPNVLVRMPTPSNGESRPRLLICDFGLSKVHENTFANTMVGTVKWTAPEVLRGDPYTTKADVFSLGTLLWELYTAQEPYPGLSSPETVQRVTAGERLLIPDTCPPRFRSVIECCWCAVPEQRPSFSRLLELLAEENLMHRPVSMRKHAFA